MGSPRRERRKKPRIKAGLAAQFAGEDGQSGVAAETVNLSTAGVCCRTPGFVEPLTKVKITLLVPESSGRKKAKTAVVHAEGVVVRSEPVATESGDPEYEVACSFTLLGAKDRKILQTYVESQLAVIPVQEAAAGWQGAGLAVRE